MREKFGSCVDRFRVRAKFVFIRYVTILLVTGWSDQMEPLPTWEDILNMKENLVMTKWQVT